MAPRQIRLGAEDNAPEPVEVYLFEHKYLLRKITRSVEKALDKAQKKMDALKDDEDGDADKVVALLGEGLGVLLMNNGTESPDPKKVITDAWKADTLGLSELTELYDGLQEAAMERPT
jgi:hypothetical protein